jgi:hypothetical protein
MICTSELLMGCQSREVVLYLVAFDPSIASFKTGDSLRASANKLCETSE